MTTSLTIGSSSDTSDGSRDDGILAVLQSFQVNTSLIDTGRTIE